jgi:hypothetical protein
MAPEQLAGARPGSAVDIFAWAVTMVFAATGRSPFGSGGLQAVMWRIMSEDPDLSGVPLSLLPVVRQCLDKDPSRRPVARDLLLRLIDPSAERSPEPPARPAYPAAMPGAGPAPATAGPTFPSDLPAGQTVQGRASGRPQRGPMLAVGAAAVVAALIIGGALLLSMPSSPGHPAATGGSGAGDPASSGVGPTSSPAATQVAGPAIPAAFSGTWTGIATLASTLEPSVTLRDPITFTLVAGAHTAHEVNQGCVNVITLTRATDTLLTFTEPQTPACEAGTVTFTRRGAGLAYRWVDVNKLARNTAILRKSS